MGLIEVQSSQLKKTLDVLTDRVKAFGARTGDRELSNAEARTLRTLEEERDATRDLYEAALEAEERQASAERRAKIADGIARGEIGNVVRTFGPSPIPAPASQTRQLGAGTEVSDPATADFRAYIRNGETRASMSYTDANGGYVVPNALFADIVDKLKEQDPILGRARIFQMAGGNDSLEVPIVDALGATAWTTETGERTEQNSPTLRQGLLQCYEVYTDWRATQRFIDSVPGIESWIVNEITETLLAAAGVRFAVGTGSSQIKGVFANYDGYAIVESGAASTLAPAGFANAYAALPQKFQPSAVWVMLPASFGAVLSFTYPGANNTVPLVQFVNGEPTIMGKPVLLSDSAPAVDTDSYSVFYGDLQSAYAVGFHQQVNVLRDPYSHKPYVSFYATARIGGIPMDDQAGVLIQTTDALVS